MLLQAFYGWIYTQYGAAAGITGVNMVGATINPCYTFPVVPQYGTMMGGVFGIPPCF
jgi:hypothetical protein